MVVNNMFQVTSGGDSGSLESALFYAWQSNLRVCDFMAKTASHTRDAVHLGGT